jgi:MFS family permease
MGKPLDPGPPLTAAEEFCACEAPSTREYVRAVGAAFLVFLAGGLGWLGLAMVLQRLLVIPDVVIGVTAGWVVHQAGGRHRSRALGLLAAAAAMLAPAAGYSALWMPFVRQPSAGWRLNGWDFLMAGVGAFVAYLLAGPRDQPKDSL